MDTDKKFGVCLYRTEEIFMQLKKNSFLRIFLALCLTGVGLTGCGRPPQEPTAAPSATPSELPQASGTVTVKDHADREVTVVQEPKRVVITDIFPLASVLTVYLGSASSIVAMEPVSMNAAKNGILGQLYPEILNVDTSIMDGEDINVESIAALEPDVIFYNAGNAKEAEKFENAGLTAVGVSATGWNYDCLKTYDEWISLLDQIYPQHAHKNKLSTRVDEYGNAVYGAIQTRVKNLDEQEKQKVLFLYRYDENTMITSGSNFFGQWWCDSIGAVNVAQDVSAENRNAVITMEQVYAWNPDVIILTNFTPTQPEDLFANAIGGDDWSGIKAVQDRRVYKMPLGIYRTYTPGADTPMTLEWLAQAVYPELFKDVNVRRDVAAYYKELYEITLTDEQIEAMYNPNSAVGSWQ